MPTPVKSSEVRSNLTQKLREVWQTGEPHEILSDGKTVALLTLKKPTGIPPLRVTLKEAREGWSELLAEVSQIRAHYFFLVRFKGLKDGKPTPPIYLVPSNYRNRFHEEWVDYRREYKASQVSTSSIQEQIDEIRDGVKDDLQRALAEMSEQLKAGVEKIEQKIGVAFAGVVRPNGNLYATPELGVVPLRSTKDLAPDVDNSK